jgi:hypothetical protein
MERVRQVMGLHVVFPIPTPGQRQGASSSPAGAHGPRVPTTSWSVRLAHPRCAQAENGSHPQFPTRVSPQ